jgi:hypothetical protein
MTATTVPAPGGRAAAAANAALADTGMARPGAARAGHQAVTAWPERCRHRWPGR